MVSYTYDAWGRPLSTTGTEATNIGAVNPLRYRGYVYDHETQFYYLQSRYYNPTLGRFINADALTSTGQGILGNNMFAYCLNNPVGYTDSGGNLPYRCDTMTNRAYVKDASQEYETIDLTEKLDEFMKHNADTLQEYIDDNGYVGAAFYFLENVVDGGELDIKLQDEWSFESNKKYIYRGKELRYDDPGNINFGYVGALLFSEEVLCFGAGLNQISKYGFILF